MLSLDLDGHDRPHESFTRQPGKEIPARRDRTSVRNGASLDEIEKVYRTRFPDFLRTAAAIAGGLDAGRDAVHDAFVAAVRGRGGYRGAGTVEAWLWRAVVTSALKVAKPERTASLERVPEVGELHAEREEVDHVRALTRRLPERQRLTLFLRYYADLDYRAIAEVLGVRVGTVGAALHAAHAALREQLEEVAR
jgi:RNA polymerase sigma-70 factor, ECF subfamily